MCNTESSPSPRVRLYSISDYFLVLGVCLALQIPLTSTWPHMRCDVGLERGEY